MQISFKLPKQDSADDIKVLIFTPQVNRETIILAKYAAIFTYFFAINFLLLTLPIFFYFLTLLNFLPALSFLLLNGLVFVLMNFLFLVPLLFHFYENFSFLSSLIVGFSIVSLFFLCYYFRENIMKYPLILPLLSIPLSILVGYTFFRLYWKKYLQKDLD